MQKLRIIWLVVLTGFPLLAWTAYHEASQTYRFWRYGIEKTMNVVALDHKIRAYKAGARYYYDVEIAGRRMIKEFGFSLPVGKNITVLAMPDEPEKITPGTRNSSLFEIFSCSNGGDLRAILVIGAYCFMVFAAPIILSALIKMRREIINADKKISETWRPY
ncbi:MAG TPA: ABC transporter permease [Gammaproteobacteria bacterium]|nr:ABC transporter permease [Gammaproteobacteria bacterium]